MRRKLRPAGIRTAHDHRQLVQGRIGQLVALQESPQKLHIDHENARWLAEALAEVPGVRIDPAKVVTNILIIDVSGTGLPALEVSKRLLERGVLANQSSPTALRMVTHYDVDRAGCERAVKAMEKVLGAVWMKSSSGTPAIRRFPSAEEMIREDRMR